MTLTTATAAKGGSIIVGGSLTAYGISELTKGGIENENTQSKLETIDPDLSLKFLFSKENFGTDGDYKSDSEVFGYAFGRFMLDPDDNSDKWSKLENQIKSEKDDNLSDKFKQVRKDQSSSDKKIQDICKESYKEKVEEFFKNENETLLTNVWQYCSPFEWTISSLGDFKNTTNLLDKWGWSNSNQYYLLNINDNDKVWKHVFKNILKKDLEDENKKNSMDDKFNTINSWDKLKNVCFEAYKTDKSNSQSSYGDNVRSYCSLNQSRVWDGYPTKPE